LLARLLQLAGAHLVGPSNGIATVNAKLLHKLDPDAYIATSTSGVTLTRLRSQPRLRTLRAVTAGRFFIVDAAAARADTTAYALLHSLAHSLHPTVIKE
jgi:ABC-type Fe3+-hydroxamate transport system substrate-binding protein